MSQSPGHQKWPEHKVVETPMKHHVRVDIDNQVIAESQDVIRVDEDQHPARYYFARHGVRMHLLERSQTTTQCPFKGTAHYYDVVLGDTRYKDAAWTYETPYDEHADLKDRLAFYEERVPELTIHVES